MKVCKDISSLKKEIKGSSFKRKTIGFIPTMGALHKGHLSLIRRAREENDIVVVSIFVNPKQFTNSQDLAKYPQTLEQDISLIHEVADVLFIPTADEMYPHGFDSMVHTGRLSEIVEGKFRPGHFDGMATVVLKLFNIISPTRAYFGKKDYQQYLIVSQFVRDFNLPIEIIGCETVRELSGLAMSSRNTRLSDDEQEKACVIFRALSVGKSFIERGEDTIEKIRHEMQVILDREPMWKTEYLEIRNTSDFSEKETVSSDVVILIAGFLGDVRLIDNVEVAFKA